MTKRNVRYRERERERERGGQVGELGGWVVRSLRCTIWVESDKVEALPGNHMHMLWESSRGREYRRGNRSQIRRERKKKLSSKLLFWHFFYFFFKKIILQRNEKLTHTKRKITYPKKIQKSKKQIECKKIIIP